MNVLVDTIILGRMAEPGHPHHRPAVDASAALRQGGDTLCVVPQVLYEFWATGTRPKSANGLGLSAAEGAAELSKLKSLFGSNDSGGLATRDSLIREGGED